MGKLLSICIPSYNMGKYLGNCLSSLEIPEIDKLEIIIVNDGSKDRTLEIAEMFRAKHPESTIIIDKKNGHYGSCVNAALKVATGKYFRILDADDWFDKTSLQLLVQKLNDFDADAIYTRYTIWNTDSGKSVEQKFEFNRYGIPINLHIEKIPHEAFQMHCLTYNRDLLNRIHYTQTEGINYTDCEYYLIPLIQANDIIFFDMSLYQYRSGYLEQSTSKSSILRNLNSLHTLLRNLSARYSVINGWNHMGTEEYAYHIARIYNMLCENIIRGKWISKEDYAKIEETRNCLIQNIKGCQPLFKDLRVDGFKYDSILSNSRICTNLYFTPLRIFKHLKYKY